MLFEKEGNDILRDSLDLDFDNSWDRYPIRKSTLPKKGEIFTEGTTCVFINTDEASQNLFTSATSTGKA